MKFRKNRNLLVLIVILLTVIGTINYVGFRNHLQPMIQGTLYKRQGPESGSETPTSTPNTPPTDGPAPTDSPAPKGNPTSKTPADSTTPTTPTGSETPKTPTDSKTPKIPTDSKTPIIPIIPTDSKTPIIPIIPTDIKTPTDSKTPSNGPSDTGKGNTGNVPTTTLPDETVTPSNNDPGKKPKHVTKYTTYLTTYVTVIPGSSKMITTTNDAGEPTVFSTYVPPSTVLVVKKMASPIDDTDNSQIDGSSSLLNAQGLWGIGMSITIVCFSMFYMILA